VASQKCARNAPARAGSDPRIEQLAGRLDRANSDFLPSPQGQPPAVDTDAILAIDIGLQGAIAFLTPEGQLIDVFGMPVLSDGPAGRRAVNAPLLAEIVFKSHAVEAFIELVGARPGEGAVGAFAFGRSRGVCEGVLASAGIPAQHIAPAAWKRAVGINRGREGAKDAARAEAIRRWPSRASLFARVKDDGRAEAALIGVAGLMRKPTIVLISGRSDASL
jgi:crossover junction endodeoxyribonuclease RuvC